MAAVGSIIPDYSKYMSPMTTNPAINKYGEIEALGHSGLSEHDKHLYNSGPMAYYNTGSAAPLGYGSVPVRVLKSLKSLV